MVADWQVPLADHHPDIATGKTRKDPIENHHLAWQKGARAHHSPLPGRTYRWHGPPRLGAKGAALPDAMCHQTPWCRPTWVWRPTRECHPNLARLPGRLWHDTYEVGPHSLVGQSMCQNPSGWWPISLETIRQGSNRLDCRTEHQNWSFWPTGPLTHRAIWSIEGSQPSGLKWQLPTWQPHRGDNLEHP